MVTLGIIIFSYAPSGVLCATFFSYVFDRAESAQSFLPNILTFAGVIPCIPVVFLDMMGISKLTYNYSFVEVISNIYIFDLAGPDVVYIMHYVFSLVNPMYIPYAAVYFVDRVYISCSLINTCSKVTMADYITEPLLVLFFASILHIPIWMLCLRIIDVRKSGGGKSDIFSGMMVSLFVQQPKLQFFKIFLYYL